jgi:tripartite-type tricarboxylate transporter receptor subunit TctC
MLRVLRFWLIVAAILGNGNALAQDYPTGPVKIILSNSAGSAPDIVARLVADRLSKTLGQQVFVENKPGGDSVLGAVLSARAAPDGYTLYFAFNDALVSNRFRLKSLPYDPDNDFTPIANIVDSAPFVVAVHPDVPAKTFGELMELARSNPGKLSYGTSIGISDTLAQWINKSANVDILRVPYRVNGQAVQDALSGRVQILLISLPSIEQFAKSGQLRAGPNGHRALAQNRPGHRTEAAVGTSATAHNRHVGAPCMLVFCDPNRKEPIQPIRHDGTHPHVAFIEHEMVCFGKKVEIFGKTRAIKHGNRLLRRSD